MSLSKQKFSIVAVSFAFFSWGFLTCLNDILIPHLKSLFDLNYAQVMLVQMAFFMTYALLSLPMAKVLASIGYTRSIALGFIISGFGCLGFLPAASYNTYGLFLFSLIILAAGIVLLQVAANPYAALLGESKTASSRLTLMQALNSLGTTIAPIFGGILILGVASQHANHEQMTKAIQVPYLLLAVILLVIGVIFAFLRLQQIALQSTVQANAQTNLSAYKTLFKHKHLVLGCIGIFVYVGAEVSIGSFLVNYFELPSIGGLTAATAAKYVAYYWGGAMVGRFVGAYILRKVSPPKVVIWHSIAAIILVATSILSSHKLAMYSIIAVGLFNSILFPTIFGLAVRELGDFTPQGSGLLCLSICGGALIPMLQGVLADHIGIQLAFVVPIICYLYILFYGASGYNKRLSLGEN